MNRVRIRWCSTGARFDEGIEFTFPTFTLAAGARCLLVSNQVAFQLRYGNGFNIAGVYGGSLDNNGGDAPIAG
jgi:hypothetical protein